MSIINSSELREIADYIEALNRVSEGHGGEAVYVQNASVMNASGDVLGQIVDEVGGYYQFEARES